MIERGVVLFYLAACVVVGVLASRRVLGSRDEYWVAGRRIGPVVNALAIMATLASGGSVLGVMGLAYATGIPATLALFAGAVVGFPLASVLVAKPLRNFGRFTIAEFLAFRYPHPVVRLGAPLAIVAVPSRALRENVRDLDLEPARKMAALVERERYGAVEKLLDDCDQVVRRSARSQG